MPCAAVYKMLKTATCFYDTSSARLRDGALFELRTSKGFCPDPAVLLLPAGVVYMDAAASLISTDGQECQQTPRPLT